ncbi:MAG: hypothetical protein AAB967_02750 [Patescibacteria group bacterium]
MATNFANTQDLVSIEAIRESAVVLKGGKILKVVMVDGVNFSLKSEEEQNIITFAYQNFLNSVDFPLQIIIHSRKINIEKYLAGLEEKERAEPAALLQNQIAEYREFIRAFVKENAIMQKTFFVVVPFFSLAIPSVGQAAGFLAKVFPFGRKKNASAVNAEAAEERELRFRENLSQLDQRVSQVVSGLQAGGLDAVVLDDENLVELFYNFYNPEAVEKKEIKMPEQQ